MFLFGASGHGKVVIDIIKSSEKELNIEAVYDDNPKTETTINIPVINTDTDILNNNSYSWIINIENNLMRKQKYKKIKGSFLKEIHKSGVISQLSTIEEGTVVMANAVITPDAKIVKHVIINSGSTIYHDCVINN